MVRRTVHLSLATALLLGACASLPLYSTDQVDANGDRAVDVLDVQLVIAQVLQGDAALERADVNQDGHVDILDFQRILQEAQDSEADEPVQDDASPDAVLVRGPDVPPTLRVRIPEIVQNGTEPANTIRPAVDEVRCRSPRTERYTFHLTSNAPPRA